MLEEPALRGGMDEFERAFVGGARIVESAEAAQRLRSGGVQVVVVVELEAIGEGERGVEVSCLGQRRGFVQPDDGRRAAGMREASSIAASRSAAS